MSTPTALTILQLVAPLAAAAVLGGLLLLARAVENARDDRNARTERRLAAAAAPEATGTAA